MPCFITVWWCFFVIAAGVLFVQFKRRSFEENHRWQVRIIKSLSGSVEASVHVHFVWSLKLCRSSAGGFTWSVPSPWLKFDLSTPWSESRLTSLPSLIPGRVWWVKTELWSPTSRQYPQPVRKDAETHQDKYLPIVFQSLSLGQAREWCIINDVACVNNQVSFLTVLNELHWLYRQVLSPRRTFERTQTVPRLDWHCQTHHYTNRTEATWRSDDRLWCRSSDRFIDPP